MSNREDIEIQNSELILPILEQLQEQVSSIEEHVVSFVPRRPIPESVKQRHKDVLDHLGGRCPCCGLITVIDEYGVNGEFDHFYSRERITFEETWLICKLCHLQMKDRAHFTDEFRSYQRRAVALEGGQLSLI